MKPTLKVSFSYWCQMLSHFGKTRLRSKMLKVLLVPQDGGLCRALSCSWAWGCLHGSCGKQGLNLTAHHQREKALRMSVTAMHPWAACSQGALFPSTGKICSDFKKMFVSCWEFSSGGVPGPLWAALLGSPTWTSVILPKSPTRLSPSLLSSVVQLCLFNAADFRRVVQEFKLLRNTSRRFMGVRRSFIDFSAWKQYHNTEAILGDLTRLLMNCCYLVVFKSQNRGSVVGKSQGCTHCTECTI